MNLFVSKIYILLSYADWGWQCNSYRIYSNKRHGTYLIFRATSAVLIRGQRLFESGAYLKLVPDKFTFSIYLFNGTLSVNFPMDWY